MPSTGKEIALCIASPSQRIWFCLSPWQNLLLPIRITFGLTEVAFANDLTILIVPRLSVQSFCDRAEPERVDSRVARPSQSLTTKQVLHYVKLQLKRTAHPREMQRTRMPLTRMRRLEAVTTGWCSVNGIVTTLRGIFRVLLAAFFEYQCVVRSSEAAEYRSNQCRRSRSR